MQNRNHIIVAAALALGACATAESPASEGPPEHGRFHHVHLNVADVERTTEFYAKTFGAVPVHYAGRQPALMAEQSFVFLDQVSAPIPSQLQTGVIHIGWSGVDGPAEFARLQEEEIEFYTPLTPLQSGHYMYLYGPDREVIEIWTIEEHHRFNHVHLLSPDPRATAEWFAAVVNSASPAEAGVGLPGYWKADFGSVALDILPDIAAFRPKERTGALQPTDGAGIDHIAFSFRDLAAAQDRVRAAGIPIERPLATDPSTGLASFFLRSREGVLVEMIQARPLPEAAWE